MGVGGAPSWKLRSRKRDPYSPRFAALRGPRGGGRGLCLGRVVAQVAAASHAAASAPSVALLPGVSVLGHCPVTKQAKGRRWNNKTGFAGI